MKLYLRLFRIYRVAVRYRLNELLDGLGRGKLLSLLLRLPVSSRSASKNMPRGVRLRLALEELGPIFIKFGQLLSTRRDLIPKDLADELAYLQDRVPPFPGSQARAIIEHALGETVDNLFREFSANPLASASVAQVHTATLPGGEEVAVKVIRPGIEEVIAQDINLMHVVARLMETYLRDGRRLRPREVVQDYEHVIFDELNLQVEAANTSQLGRNFENSKSLYVPKVYWDYCRKNVLVMELIHGIPVTNVEALKSAGINLQKLAETGVQIFFTQVFNHSFFHADMHPGNIFVSPEHKENPQYIAIDCAIIGSLSQQDQYYLARNLLAIFKRDYRRVAELHVECGWVPVDTPVNAFEATMRSVCEPVFEKPLKDISFGMILLQLFQTARRFNMEVQPSLVLLQKTLLNIEGLGKQLYPDLDLWQTALPFLEDWRRKRLSPWENLKKIQARMPEWIEQIPELPDLVYETLSESRRARRSLHELLDSYETHRREETAIRSRRRLRYALGLLTAAAVAALPPVNAWLLSIPAAVWVLLAGGIILLAYRD